MRRSSRCRIQLRPGACLFMLKRYAGAVYAVALGLALALPLCLPVPVQAQSRLVPIPAKAKRAQMTFDGSMTVVVDGKVQARLAPGVRIFGRDNLLLLYGNLSGTATVKYLQEESSGLLMNIWVLTNDEIATPDPKPAS